MRDEKSAWIRSARVWTHQLFVNPQVYLPARCSTCRRTDLLRAAPGAELSCRHCGGAASVVPGETYGEGDVPLFERVSVALGSDLTTARAARKIAAELRDARGRGEPHEAILLRLTDDLPSLRFLIQALCSGRPSPGQRTQMARAIGMVITIAQARVRDFETLPS